MEAMSQDKQGELKSCPFCGGEAKLMKSRILINGYHVYCRNKIGCGAEIDGEILDDADEVNYLNKEQIIKHWNTRHAAEPLVKQNNYKRCDDCHGYGFMWGGLNNCDEITCSICGGSGDINSPGQPARKVKNDRKS